MALGLFLVLAAFSVATPIQESRAFQPKSGPSAASTISSQPTSQTQLDFSSRQQGHDVSINCTLRDASTTGLSLVIGMAVSRITDTGELVLASVTSLGSAPITHTGAVTSSVSLDGRQDSYINIEWSSANSSLEGDYVCRVNGLDVNNSPVVLSQELSLTLQEPGPGVRATPEILQLGLTKLLSIKCYISGFASNNISEVTSIGLSYIHDGIDQLLITHSVFEGTEIKPGSGVVSSTGHLSTAEDEENFLEATWQNPSLNRTGKYECSFSGLDTSGHPVYFESTLELNHVEPSKEELLQQLEDLRNKFESLTQEKEDLRAERDKIELKIRVLEESVKGHKICDTVDLPVGKYPIKLFPDDGQGLVEVLCDVVSPGDVWTIFQKRFNGSESFSRGFVAYDVGFGSVLGEHWLGFKQMKRIMTTGKYQIRVDIADHNSTSYTRIYPQFSVGAFDGYTLTVDGYNDGGHGLSFSSGAEFSTLDHGPQPHCAAQDNGGWWYYNCAFTNLNGQWGHAGESGISWFELPDGRIHPLTKTEMKFKKSSQP
ncbi:unnamed protein product [Candidula unifasciata]|uniref:Fibrinogen C-terminal domain-containing protein n=1 Tax=Candidula unifasciata TaxID=100452 RepID=A0A8S3Z7D4_9EUPU|nr:unnamed protein product [Candidula unifasciata]